MRVLVYGAGALGQAIGCMLAADGHQVTLVLRPRFIDVLQAEGLTVTGIFGTYQISGKELELITELQQINGSDIDLILLTTKTYGTDAAIDEIVALSQCTCPVVSLQNGCGNLEKLTARLGKDRSLAARVITGFEIEQPGQVKITVSADAVHIGGSVRGNIPPAAQQLAEALDHAGLPAIAVNDIYQSLYAKLLYNCALNPLGAILGVHYGALGESKDIKQIMNKVIDETFSVIHALGGTTPWPDAETYRTLFYDNLVPATYHHRASMLQDLENNKPTEVEAMVGYVSTQGRLHGVETPACELLADLLRFKEQQQQRAAR
ncbi:ketopantoate reductase family protein [Desulfobulbus rhabdoformis]|uniref:ketopantoate reductase family protein n=1 Tax=Desulfobulbus rhabdoformis TaxID=34032 RepID=UPI0019638D05|nr:ketopantoate reductase family protein [Desulfobulbus rhabdoformis]MBM9615030.1 ketopantoate reductase family protein [Desulfobulbus rhabdoformis]